jgi:hypothetical protein
MRRNVKLSAVGAAVAAAVIVGWFSLGSRTSPPTIEPRPPRADSVWYHESDVALLAKTGRPQLVEFFHPG